MSCGESIFDLLGGRAVSYDEIRNVEAYREVLEQNTDKEKISRKTNSPLSQIEKFKEGWLFSNSLKILTNFS